MLAEKFRMVHLCWREHDEEAEESVFGMEDNKEPEEDEPTKVLLVKRLISDVEALKQITRPMISCSGSLGALNIICTWRHQRIRVWHGGNRKRGDHVQFWNLG